MNTDLIFEEKIHDGVVIRRSIKYPKLWAAEDGRISGVRGHWLKPFRHPLGHLQITSTIDKLHVIVLVHRLVAEVWIVNQAPETNTYVDHVDGNPSNNNVNNLRWVTRRQNQQNQKCHREGTGSSGFIGVSFHKQVKKYLAQICKDGRLNYLGAFCNEEAAAKAYDEALVELGLAPVNFKI